MFAREYNGTQYVFYDDRLTVNGVSVPYSEMSNITHREGDPQTGSAPAFLFDYRGRRFSLAYRPEDLQSILPYFAQANQVAGPAAAVSPAAAEPAAAIEAPKDAYLQADPEALAGESFIQKKRFWTKGKVIALVFVVVVLLVIVFAFIRLGGFGNAGPDPDAPAIKNEAAEHAPDQELATQEDTVEATDGFTVTDFGGAVKVELKKAYVGDEAIQKLTDMGEYAANYEEANNPAYKTVLYEYNVKVLEGVLEGDPITGDAYYPDKKTELDDCWGYILDVNNDKDITSGNVTLRTGKSATVYCVYAMPSDVTDYYEKVYADTSNRTIWVHYVLDQPVDE